SFATPIAAGAAACLWQANPGKTNMQLIKAIVESATQYSKPDSLLGYGIPNMCAASLMLGGYNYSQFQTDNILLAYPNPFENRIQIAFYSVDSQMITVQLFDIRGRKITDETQH